MMKIWLIWVQEGDDATWLEAAWDDNSTAENREGYEADVDRVQKMCLDSRYEMRIQAVMVPKVFELFEFPPVFAHPVES